MYNEYYICNSYGVFGFINQKRYVTIVSFKYPNEDTWKELVYKILPRYETKIEKKKSTKFVSLSFCPFPSYTSLLCSSSFPFSHL